MMPFITPTELAMTTDAQTISHKAADEAHAAAYKALCDAATAYHALADALYAADAPEGQYHAVCRLAAAMTAARNEIGAI